MTYDELKTKIRDYTEVSSTVLSDTIINGRREAQVNVGEVTVSIT